MKLSSQIKPISYLKAHAAKIVRTLCEQQEPLIITRNGDPGKPRWSFRISIQDIDSYEQTQETIALLKILALGSHQIEVSHNRPTTSSQDSGRVAGLADALPGSTDR